MPSRASHLLALAAACLGLAFGLAACGGDDDSGTASVQLTELSRDPQNGPSPGRPSDGRLAGADDSVSEDAPPSTAGGEDAGDGGDDDASGESDAPAEDAGDAGGANAEGEAIFAQSCAGCHTLAAAGASGTVGPNLDDTSMDQAAIAEKIRAGGGGMPSFGGQLEQPQIDAVAEYVAGAAGS
jgi:mono/diheme cytochrome c family protein